MSNDVAVDKSKLKNISKAQDLKIVVFIKQHVTVGTSCLWTCSTSQIFCSSSLNISFNNRWRTECCCWVQIVVCVTSAGVVEGAKHVQHIEVQAKSEWDWGDRKGRDYRVPLLRLHKTDHGFVHWQLHSLLHHTDTAWKGKRQNKV